MFLNDGGTFEFVPFTMEVQQSPVNSILFDDFDGDGINDLLLAGNNYQREIETTRSDAGIGSFLMGNGSAQFKFITNYKHGFFADKDVRNMVILGKDSAKSVLVINNNDFHQRYLIKR